jgi:restriction system protein
MIAIITTTLIIFLLFFFFTGKKNFKKRRHRKRIKQASNVLEKLRSFEGRQRRAQIFTYLRKIHPNAFEELLLTTYEKKGYRIERNKRYTGDGGVDGAIYDLQGRKILIQSKRYSGFVRGEHLMEFSKIVYRKKAFMGYFIHTGKTSAKNLQSIKFSNIEIISGNKLIELIL